MPTNTNQATMILEYFLVSLIINIPEVSTLTGTYGGSIDLECGHNIENHRRISWYYEDKYNGDALEYAARVESDDPPIGEGDFQDRSYVDFTTGYMNISQLNWCHDDQTYICEVRNEMMIPQDFLNHTVIIGKLTYS